MKQPIQLGFLSVVNIGLVFTFQLYIFTQLGMVAETDALFAGMTLPQVFLAVVSSSLMHVLVPVLTGKSIATLRRETWDFIFLIAGFFSFIAMLLYSTAFLWVPFIVPGFNETTKNLTIELTQIQLIGLVFTGINGVQWAAYHANQKFIWVELTSIIANFIALMALIIVLPYFGIISAAWIMVLRVLLQTILLAPYIGLPSKPSLKSPTIKKAWRRIKPLLIGTLYYKTDPLIDRFLLSFATAGNLSLYYLSQQVYAAINQVINKAIVAPLVPVLSKLHQALNMKGFREIYYLKILQVSILSIVCLLIIYLFGQALLKVLIGYGSFEYANIVELWWIMIWLGGVLIGGALGQICASAFYSIGDTKTPTIISIITYTIYVPSKVGSFYFYGVKGLAIATTIYYICNFLVQFFTLKQTVFNNATKNNT